MLDVNSLKVHTCKDMGSENRRDMRYEDIGRVDSLAICALPGILNDISRTGCKVHFPISVTIDMENDYELRIKSSKKNITNSLLLICHPKWINNCDDGMEIGFEILRSPDTPLLIKYINALKINSDESNEVQDILNNTRATFV